MKPLAVACFVLLAACAVNPVPTPAARGGAFSFGGGGFDAASQADTAGTPLADSAAGDTVDPRTAGDSAATADAAGPPEDAAGLADAEPGDGVSRVEDTVTDVAPADSGGGLKDAKSDAAPDVLFDAKSDTKADAKPDAKADGVVAAPTFGAVYTGVIKKYGCAATLCHGPKGQPYLFADQAVSYQHLVGIGAGATYACSGATLVVPGDAKTSLLWQKVAPGTTACGDKMPVVVGGDGIEPEDAALVEAWIQAGAKP